MKLRNAYIFLNFLLEGKISILKILTIQDLFKRNNYLFNGSPSEVSKNLFINRFYKRVQIL
ncbi:hypothetical protein BpHYR1_017187 [Brachionus plicatilis]|uniref:Uncharacterized protein n=1 Tax=Brachionus plicatilis TaxID=10195 RepID=A0A3M7QID5_BRAPC|nr:hypothetical protein BpHYR1_017187 [Brachionus plicatilis]